MAPTLEPQVETSPLRLYHHYFYIVFWVALTSSILYLVGGISYIDALLLASGAATQSGLNPVNLNELHIVQQVVLWMVAMVTNVVFMHSLLVVIRLYWFRARFRRAILEAKSFCHAQRGQWNEHLREMETTAPTIIGLGRTVPVPETIPARNSQEQALLSDTEGNISTSPHITFHDTEVPERRLRRSYSSYSRHSRSWSISDAGNPHDLYGSTVSTLPPLMWQDSIASYSQWDESQKDELGGIEYRALKTLMIILVVYFLAFHLLAMFGLMAWVASTPQYGWQLDKININQFWWATFTAGSAFNDLGYTLTPDSMVPFRDAPVPLIVMTFLIVMGNTGFPCMLRLVIWVLYKVVPASSARKEELRYLLKHPRRCFTLLFPKAETWFLAAVLLLLNVVDMGIFFGLHESTLPTGLKFLNGLFQIASTRTAGFTTTSLSTIHPAIQVSFLVMMYISAFPTAIAMRRTNVYEEKSLGIYYPDSLSPDSPERDTDTTSTLTTSTTRTSSPPENQPNAHQNLVSHIQHQLGFDLWYVMLGFFLLAVTEGKRLQDAPGDVSFSLFPILFELVSAYGTVGLSLGYPMRETSLCGEFNWVSKVIVVAMEVRGRHRGLPHALDCAILLPCERDTYGEGGEWWWRRWLKRGSNRLSLFGETASTRDGGGSGNGMGEMERLV